MRWRLLYGGRSRSSMAFVAELENLRPHRVGVVTEDATGLLDLESALHAIDHETEVYCCGSPGLVDAGAERATAGVMYPCVSRASGDRLVIDV